MQGYRSTTTMSDYDMEITVKHIKGQTDYVNFALPMRVPNPDQHWIKNPAPMGPEILSSTGDGVWRKAPKAFPDSCSALDKFQAASVWGTAFGLDTNQPKKFRDVAKTIRSEQETRYSILHKGTKTGGTFSARFPMKKIHEFFSHSLTMFRSQTWR